MRQAIISIAWFVVRMTTNQKARGHATMQGKKRKEILFTNFQNRLGFLDNILYNTNYGIIHGRHALKNTQIGKVT